MAEYDAVKNARESYDLAIEKCREKLESFPRVEIGDCVLFRGDCMEIMPLLPVVDHIICDPPYEASLHASKNSLTGPVRLDSGPELKGLNFAPIDSLRPDFIKAASAACSGWFVSFCSVEGVGNWVSAIKVAAMKYKRGCVWVKPDSTPQLNGQGPAQGAECFVTAWCGRGRARWNAGGKRGVYTHCVNPPDRTGLHPTEKPWRLMAEIIKDFTNERQIILDPFMGSGTTLVACAKMGRRGIGIELDPKYFDIACKRVEEAYAQPDLFVEASRPAEPEQFEIFDDGRAA